MQEKNKTVNKNTLVLWAITFGIPFLIYFLPISDNSAIMAFTAVTLWAVLAWMTTIIPVEVTGLAIPCLYLLLGVLPAEAAFSPYANTVVWNTAGIILVGIAIDHSGIAKRMAYSILLRFDCSLRGLIWGFAVSGFLMSFIITDQVARTLIFISIAIGLCQSLNIEPKSKEATALAIAAFFAMCNSIFTMPGSNGIYINSIYRNVVNMDITYTQWLLANIVPGIFLTIATAWGIIKILDIDKGKAIDARQDLQKNKDALGKMSRYECTVLAVLILLVLNYMFSAKFGLDPLLITAVIMPLLFLPKIGIITAEDFNTANFKIIFVMTGAICIGVATNEVGLINIIFTTVSPFLENSPVFLAFGAMVICGIANFVFTPLAIVFTLTEPLVQIAVDLGFNPLPIAYAINLGTEIYFFPYEYALLLLCYSFNLMSYKDTIKMLTFRSLCIVFIFGLVGIPIWKLIGIL